MNDDSDKVAAKFKLGDVSYVPHKGVMYECTIVSIKNNSSRGIIYGSKAKEVFRTFYRKADETLTKEEAEIVKRSWNCLL